VHRPSVDHATRIANARSPGNPPESIRRTRLHAQLDSLIFTRRLTIGAGIASSIPTTESEKKVMGETSNFIRDTVTEKAAQVKDMADAALQEVKAQGLTPEAAGEALHTLGEKVGGLGQAATSQPGQERGGSASTKTTSPRLQTK
jgi:hypothetical protein